MEGKKIPETMKKILDASVTLLLTASVVVLLYCQNVQSAGLFVFALSLWFFYFRKRIAA